MTTTSRAREVRRAARAEMLKLTSLPATCLVIAGAFAASVVLAIAFAVAGKQGSTGTAAGLDIGLAPVGYTQAAFIVLGVVAATSEYQGGQIQVTLVAMPRRVTQHLAKMTALVFVAVPTALTTVAAGIFAAGFTLGSSSSAPRLSDALTAVAGASAYLTLTAVISAAVATVVRRSIPALVCLLVYYFIVGPLLRDRLAVATYLPDTAGYSMWFQSGAGRDGALGALAGAAVVVAWVLFAVAVSATSFRRRDA